MPEPAGMEFPTFFRLRVVGRNDGDFASFLLERLLPFIPELQPEHLEVHLSGGGKYLAVHVEFFAQSREQMDGIYGDLSGHERVLWVM
ncbi:MAG: DUF493 domain-containing protein [Bellilinea sp.]